MVIQITTIMTTNKMEWLMQTTLTKIIHKMKRVVNTKNMKVHHWILKMIEMVTTWAKTINLWIHIMTLRCQTFLVKDKMMSKKWM
jgi:hypothetical protein